MIYELKQNIDNIKYLIDFLLKFLLKRLENRCQIQFNYLFCPISYEFFVLHQ